MIVPAATASESDVLSPSFSPGRLFILSAPSGTGKTTLCKGLLAHFNNLTMSISHTTRPPRANEQDGRDYFFISRPAFEKAIERGQWLEWAQVHDNYYGTSAAFVQEKLQAGFDILLDIDVQGSQQVFQRYPDSVGIFIMPPYLAELRRRLEKRGQDAGPVIEKRLAAAAREMAHKDRYHHVVVNDDLAEALSELISLIASYR